MQAERPNVESLTVLFFLLYFLCATQAVANALAFFLHERAAAGHRRGWMGSDDAAKGERGLRCHDQCHGTNSWLCPLDLGLRR